MATLRNKDISIMLKKRFNKGYYAMSGIPSERDLADELGVARMTARRALANLVEEGYLIRKSTGRLALGEPAVQEKKKICLLTPTMTSSDVALWLEDLNKAAEQLHVTVCPVYYSEWDDVVFHGALEGFDGMFFIPRAEDIPNWIYKKLEKASSRIVVLGYDLTERGFPSLSLFPPIFISQLLDHLFQNGHREIDCFNVQPHNSTIQQRIDQWEFWRSAHRVEGQLLELGDQRGHEGHMCRNYISGLIKAGEFNSTALLCISLPAAVGACRALRDHGLEVGKDISVCVIDGEMQAELYCPSITSIERPDTTPYLSICMDWMLSMDEEWKGSLLIEASSVRIHIGESSGPAAE